MAAQVRRRFTLLDAMVLVMATAVVIRCYRGFHFLELYSRIFSATRDIWAENTSTSFALGRIAHLVPHFLWRPQLFVSVWMVTLFVLRWIPPRARRRRLATQPGTVACGVVSLVLVVEVALSSALVWCLKWTPATGKLQHVAFTVTSGDAFRYLTPLAAWAVAASWMVLAAGGRWRPEPDWIDRTGRLFGALWIATIPFYVWVTVTNF